jgi:hypothetical protein
MVGNDGIWKTWLPDVTFTSWQGFSLLNPQAHLKNNPEFIKEIKH